MVQNVKDEFEQVLLNSDWMDSETQKLAIIKLKEMKDIIGYPNELANESIVIQEYDIYFVSIREQLQINFDLVPVGFKYGFFFKEKLGT